ncbi:MAG: hypothetical protein K5768_03635 [Firmicutes bacterium]|nr:hypothetical protein [Bacillota bacterium]
MKKNNIYENSTQEWIGITDIKNGIVELNDGRFIKVLEILPVNFYLKSEVEQENIIFYFAAYLKVAPDNIQIRVVTQRADIDDYLERLENCAENERNELCKKMIFDEMNFVKGLSDNTAVKKRFFIVFEYAHKSFDGQVSVGEAIKYLSDEAYKAERYLSQCGLEVINTDDDGFLINLFYGIINKHTSKFVKPGNFDGVIFDEVITDTEEM